MSFFEKLNPFYWLGKLKDTAVNNAIVKNIGKPIKVAIVAGLTALVGAGFLSPEEAEQASIAFGPVVDGTLGLAAFVVVEFIRSKKKK